MPDEVVARAEQLRQPHRVRLEVHALDRRVRRKARPLQYHELEALGERALRAPRPGAADHAAVHEDETFHPSILTL